MQYLLFTIFAVIVYNHWTGLAQVAKCMEKLIRFLKVGIGLYKGSENNKERKIANILQSITMTTSYME